MVASLLKVLTTGIEDERLYFKETLYPFMKIWYRAGRFTTQWTRFDFDNTPTFGNTAFFRITRRGHLCTRLFLVTTMPDIYTAQAEAILSAGDDFAGPRFGWTNSLGHALIYRAQLDIGGSRVENLDGRLLEVMDEFCIPLEKTTATNRLIKRADNGFTQLTWGNDPAQKQTTVITPLPFWFARGDPGCALPVDAIAYDEIRVGIHFRTLNGVYYTDSRVVNNTSFEDGTSLWPIVNSPFYRYDAGGTVVPGLADSAGNPVTSPVSPIQGITMPGQNALQLGETYILAEFAYLDQPEANRFRLADIQVPIVQHYAMKSFDTHGLPRARIPVDVPNPMRDLFWMVQRREAPTYNAHFLATRDLKGTGNSDREPWWPDALGLSATQPNYLRPAWALRNSEPILAMALTYEGNLVRLRTEAMALFRSGFSSIDQKKSPWVNRYYYNFSPGIQNLYSCFSRPRGEANLDKIERNELVLEFAPARGSLNINNVHHYVVHIWAETYNMLRVYGGRAGVMFAY